MFKKILDLSVKLIGVLLILFSFILLAVSGFIKGNVEVSDIIRDTGIAMFPVGLITLIYEYFLRKQFLELIKEEISKSNKRIYSDRSNFDFLKLTKNATNEVCILDTSLTYFYGISGFLPLIKERLKEGCNFRLLALNPESTLTQCRAEDAGEDLSFTNELNASITQFCKFKLQNENYKGKIEIKKYDCTPTCMLFIVENKIIMGSVLRDRRGRDSMQVEINKIGEEKIYQQLYDHFNSIWNDKKTKPSCEEN